MSALAAYESMDSGGFVYPSGTARTAVRHHLTNEVVRGWQGAALSTLAFGVDQTPNWLPAVYGRMQELMSLDIGWDGHNGQPVSRDIAGFAIEFLLQTMTTDGPPPQLVPLSYGGVQLEWHEKEIDLEIEVEAPNRIFVSFEDHQSGEEFEKEFSTEYREVTRVLRMLAVR